MQLGFGPEDDEAFADARDALIEDLRAWADGGGLDVEVDAVRCLLEMKSAQMDGRLTRWRVADLEELLTEVVPRRLPPMTPT